MIVFLLECWFGKSLLVLPSYFFPHRFFNLELSEVGSFKEHLFFNKPILSFIVCFKFLVYSFLPDEAIPVQLWLVQTSHLLFFADLPNNRSQPSWSLCCYACFTSRSFFLFFEVLLCFCRISINMFGNFDFFSSKIKDFSNFYFGRFSFFFLYFIIMLNIGWFSIKQSTE